MTESAFPSRYENREEARRRFGADADRYARFYGVGDPLADALVGWIERNGESAKAQFDLALRRGVSSVPGASPELRRFFERADALPAWVDFDQIQTGALAYQRFGILGMIVLSAWSLINGYHSSAAVKPLAFIGALRDRAQRPLAETARFVSEATQIDGLRLGRPGPDEDSRALTEQLLQVPGQNAKGQGPPFLALAVSRIHNGLARAFNGPEIAEDLGIPDDLWQYSVYPIRAAVAPFEWLRRRVPGANRLASQVGNRAVRGDLTRILRGEEPSFTIS